ncbi:hypothetical protein FGO68_gene3662 [Halteria grandinella]|uniref:Uncharacterized protein n=1 Tax=Halteria grandinella TaxID=5974 RepID=A0A8J8NYC9_HALGN|nr:hypothetical protein FGO68_gene3662 [Halteria grandinella]
MVSMPLDIHCPIVNQSFSVYSAPSLGVSLILSKYEQSWSQLAKSAVQVWCPQLDKLLQILQIMLVFHSS